MYKNYLMIALLLCAFNTIFSMNDKDKITELEKKVEYYENFISDLKIDVKNKSRLNGDFWVNGLSENYKAYLSIRDLLKKYNLDSEKSNDNKN